MKIKNAYELRKAYYEKNPGGHYFDPATLTLFGESMRSMRLLEGTAQITDSRGVEHECIRLISIQEWGCERMRVCTYFDVETLDDVRSEWAPQEEES
jgi:hypothetical protein